MCLPIQTALSSSATMSSYLRVITEWEQKTGLNTEETEYKAIYSRDVNNYVAVKKDGKTKNKGAFALGSLSKNPANENLH